MGDDLVRIKKDRENNKVKSKDTNISESKGRERKIMKTIARTRARTRARTVSRTRTGKRARTRTWTWEGIRARARSRTRTKTRARTRAKEKWKDKSKDNSKDKYWSSIASFKPYFLRQCSNAKNYENTFVNNLFYHTCTRHQRCIFNVVVVRLKIYFWKIVVW